MVIRSKVGDKVNLEFDYLAKFAENYLKQTKELDGKEFYQKVSELVEA